MVPPLPLSMAQTFITSVADKVMHKSGHEPKEFLKLGSASDKKSQELDGGERLKYKIICK